MSKLLPVFVRSAHNYDMSAASGDCGLCCEDKSLTQQHFLAETDINDIMRRFGQGERIPDKYVSPQYLNFTDTIDFREALHVVSAAQQSFAMLPASLRKRFDHDPGSFLSFVQDDANRAEAVSLGLVPALVLPDAVKAPVSAVPIVPPPAS